MTRETQPTVTKSIRIDLPLWEAIKKAGYGGRGEFSDFARDALDFHLNRLKQSGSSAPGKEHIDEAMQRHHTPPSRAAGGGRVDQR